MKHEMIKPDVKQIFNASELKGKVVDRFAHDRNRNMLIFFTDKTVAVFKYDRDEEDESAIYLSTRHYPFTVSEYTYKDAYTIGTITKQQFLEFEKLSEKKEAELKEYQEKAELERLQAKYPKDKSSYVKNLIRKHLDEAAEQFDGDNPLNIAIRDQIRKTPISLKPE